MDLPHLTQCVLLERYQPGQVLRAIDQVQTEIINRDPQKGQRMAPGEALALKPLTQLGKRLAKLQAKDDAGERRKKPHQVRVAYDEMAALRLLFGRLQATRTELVEHLQLAAALGRFHQPSLSIETHIRLPAPTGPGCQIHLL